MDRRNFLGNLSWWGLALVGVSSGCADNPVSSLNTTWKRPRFSAYPFSLGVASGDPLADGVVLWTRLAPDPLEGGGMPLDSVRVQWRLAADENMRNIVQQGTAIAAPDSAHSVHVEVSGLESDRWYWYQFSAGSEESPIGRTRTVPSHDAAVDRLNFVFASCQHYEQGLYTSLRHLAEEDIDLVFHLGDYIYERVGIDPRVRKHTGTEIETMWDYRNRYALYKADADLQAAHHAFPWIVTSDDHEVNNNYAGAISERNDPVEEFLARRANAYQAYYEHMPLRMSSIPSGPDMRLYRSVDFGNLAQFYVLDTRQYRTDQPCGDRSGPLCHATLDLDATLMGPEQEQWLYNKLDESRSKWNVLAQQVMMARVDRRLGAEERYSMDQWSGYEAARNRLFGYLHDRQPSNPIVLTGDIHSNWVNDLKTDFDDRSSATVATEFVGTSLSSGGDGADTRPSTEGLLAENPFVKFFNGQRGYVRCEVTPGLWRADYRVVEYVSRPGASISTRASFVVEEGKAGVERA